MRSTYDLRLAAAPRARLGGILARSALVAVLMGALGFFVTLLFSIVILLVAGGLVDRFNPDITLAYRQVAPAVAGCVLVLAFVANLIWEFRNSQRT